MAALVILLLAILFVACFQHRRASKKERTKDVENIQNAAYVGDAQPDRRPSPLEDDGLYEEPAIYAQLDQSRRVPIDRNYQSLNVEGYESIYTDPNSMHEIIPHC